MYMLNWNKEVSEDCGIDERERNFVLIYTFRISRVASQCVCFVSGFGHILWHEMYNVSVWSDVN